MKKVLFIALMALFTISCAKDGIDGIDGKDGINGVDGQDGQTLLVETFTNNDCTTVIFGYDTKDDGVTKITNTINSFTVCDGADGQDAEYEEEVYSVCHKGNTINISLSALPAHLAHGDTYGECE